MARNERIRVLRVFVRVDAPPLEIVTLERLARRLIERAEKLAQDSPFAGSAQADVEFIEGSLAIALNLYAELDSFDGLLNSESLARYFETLRPQVDRLGNAIVNAFAEIVSEVGAVIVSSRISRGSLRSLEAFGAYFPEVDISFEKLIVNRLQFDPGLAELGPRPVPSRRLKVRRDGTAKLVGGRPPTAKPDEDEQPGEPSTRQLVFFGTDRGRAPAPVHFGTDRAALSLGHCVLSVPTDRKPGTLPRAKLFGEWPSRHYILQGIYSQERQDFLQLLKSELSNDPDRQVLLFVHGFGVSFDGAAYRTAQIAADLEFKGAAAMFSWPSLGRISKEAYFIDEGQADYAVPHLAEFIQLLVKTTQAKALHVIAHSMGNRLLGDAVQTILKSMGIRFTELVLAAPDIDADVFQNQIAPALIAVTRRATLYVSSNDEALMKSGGYHAMPRIGDSSAGIVLAVGIETVDASAVKTDLFGHSYYATNRSVLGDVFYVLRGLPPASRFGLHPVTTVTGDYWRIKP